MSRRDAPSLAVLAGLGLLVVASALDWAAHLGWRELTLRPHDYAWELQLAWLAARGRVAQVDFAYAVGPLHQLLAALGAGLSHEPARIVGGMHLAFPLASLAVCVGLSRALTDPDDPALAWRRVGLLLGLALFALHDDVRSLRGLANAIVIFAYRPGRIAEDVWPGPDRAGALRVGGALALAAALSVDTLLLGLGSIGLMAVYEVGVRGRLGLVPAARRLGGALGVLLAALALWAAVVTLRGGSPVELLDQTAAILRAYPVAMSLGAGRVPVASILLLLALAALPLAWIGRLEVPRYTAGVWIVGALAVTARALYRTDPEHVYGALVPLAAVLVALAVRRRTDGGTRFVASSLAVLLLLASVFPMSRRTAWRPGALVEAVRALGGEARPAPVATDLARATAALRDAPAGCGGVTLGLGVAHVAADRDGPTVLQLPWTDALRRDLAARIEGSACPTMVTGLFTFDAPYAQAGWTFGPDLLARAALYAPARRLGPALFEARLRDEPARSVARAIEVDGVPLDREVQTPASVTLRFPTPIAADHLLRLRYRVEPDRGALWGAPVYLTARALAGPDALRDATLVGGLEEGVDATAVVPLDAEHAEWRWIAGWDGEAPRADRIELRVESLGARPTRARFRVDAVEVLAPPPAERRPAPVCQGSSALLARPRWTRMAAPRIGGDPDDETLTLQANRAGEPHAETFVEVTPCADACLVGEVGLAEGATTARLEVHAIDGPVRALLFARDVAPGFRTPFEVPLAPHAGRRILLRFGAPPPAEGAGGALRVRRPRVAPCASRESLVHALHQGRFEAVRGDPRVEGDRLALPVPPWGSAPAEVRLPVPARALDEHACLAFDASGEALDGTAVLHVEALRRGRAEPIARVELRPGEARRVADVPLAAWAGEDRTLVVSVHASEAASGGALYVLRPRVHGCGDGAPWAFGGEGG